MEFIFGEKNNYHQIGNAYIQYEMTKEKDGAVAANRVLVDANVIRLVNYAFAYCFKEARVSTTVGSDIGRNKYNGQVSTIMIALTSKIGDIISHFDEIVESEAENCFINNHDVAANKGKNKEQLPSEQIFGFCRTFKTITKQLRFHLSFKTAELQDIIYTSIGDDSKVSFDELFLYVPVFSPDSQTQIMFNDSIQSSFTLSIDSWITDRKTVDTQLE